MNISRAVHPPADRDLAAGGGAAARRARPATRSCRSRRCRASTSRPSNVSAALPGRQPRDDGLGGGDAARAPLRPHRRRHRDDLDAARSASTSITLQFDLDRDVDARRARRAGGHQRRRRRAAAEPADPPELPQGQPGRRADPDPLAAPRRPLPLAQVFDAANTVLAQKISQVEGVGQVFVGGGQQPAVRVQVDPAALAGVGPGLEDVRAALGRARRSNQPKGALSAAAQTQHASPPTISSSAPTPISQLIVALPERRGGAAGRRGARHRRRREQPRRRLDRRRARGAA